MRIASLLLLALASSVGLAQSYPAKPIKLVVGFSPGGAADFVARVIGEHLGRELGQPIVVENRPGAGSSLAAESVAKSAPDGYTLLIASPSSMSVNPAMKAKPGFEPSTDLVPITKLTASPLVAAVHPGLGVDSIRELIAAAKKAPGKLNFASSGNGSAPHLAATIFSRAAGIDIVHVPFKGGAPAVQSVVSGDTQLTFATPPSVLPLVHAGRLRALAITSRERSPLFPGLPGMEEAGLANFDVSFWYGLFAPKGTPAAVVQRLFDATTTVLAKAEVKAALAREGTETAASRSPEAFAAFLADDARLWEKAVKDSGAKVD